MSCIAGVGGDVKALVHIARSGRPIVAIDGCALHCVRQVLAKQGLSPDVHIDLGTRGVKKRQHEDFDTAQALTVLEEVDEVVRTLKDRRSS